MSPTEKNDFNILFTCAGRRVALLRAFREAMEQLGVTGRIIATDITMASAAFHQADLGLLVPLADADHYINELLGHVQRERVRLLVPLTDLDLVLLARHREDFLALGCTVMIGSEPAVRLCRDKSSTHRMLEKAGLATIRTVSLEEFLGEPFYPCFVKPIWGSAGVGAAVIHDKKELQAHVASFGERLIVQEYLSGQEFTIDIYRSRDGEVRCVVPRQRLVIRSGEVEKGITVKDENLIEEARRFASMIDGLWGVYCCQCRRGNDGSRPRFFEINSRFGGGSLLSIAAGANLPMYLVQEVLGLPITATLGEFTDKLLMLRYDEAVYVPVSDPGSLPGFTSPLIR